jgi:hypothetical protein
LSHHAEVRNLGMKMGKRDRDEREGRRKSLRRRRGKVGSECERYE